MEFNYKITPSAKALYQNGVDFQKAAERCLNMDETGTIRIIDDKGINLLPAPAEVNSTFACEMFFKSLILKSGQKYPVGKDGHNLKVLYDMLPDSIKKRICQFCVSSDVDSVNQFEVFLSEHSRDFVDVRYYVTQSGWQGMSPIMVYTYTNNIGIITKYLLSNWEVDTND